jgi:cytidine deaminase
MEITQLDEELIKAATNAINTLYKYGKHHVGAAIRTKSGRVVTGVNVDTYVGRMGICAEGITLGKMISEGEDKFVTIVAVYKPSPVTGSPEPYVASPCGACREMITDYCPDASVIYMEDNAIKKTLAKNLLPGKYIKKEL